MKFAVTGYNLSTLRLTRWKPAIGTGQLTCAQIQNPTIVHPWPSNAWTERAAILAIAALAFGALSRENSRKSCQ